LISRRVIPFISRGTESNSYLIEGEEAIAIIDTGMGGEVTLKVKRSLSSFQGKELFIVNTHCHVDHTRGNNTFKGVVMMHEIEAKNALDPRVNLSYLFDEPISLKTDKEIKDEDEIDLGGYFLRVLHTPGHTSGSICLYSEEDKVLFSGDTFFPEGGIGRTDFPTGDLYSLIDSLERLLSLDFEYLCPGHGPVVRNGRRHLNLAIEIAKSLI